MLLKSDLPTPPLLKEEIVSVSELGGDVLVRGMLLQDRLEIAVFGGKGSLAKTLSVCVFVEGDKGTMVPLYTADEWERWGCKHYVAALSLWDKARAMSDLDSEEAEKNSQAQNSDSPAA